MSGSPDIDIDFADRKSAMMALDAIPAMIEREGKRTAHPSGVYLQDMPIDPFTNLASVDYKAADQLGYFKIDLLNQSVYESVRDEAHLTTLLATEPYWDLLDDETFVEQLPHIHNHHGAVMEIKPKSIQDLAVVLALVRPGKKHLRGRSRADIDAEIWVQGDDGYVFKRAHAIAYSALVVVAMNLLCESMLSGA